MEDWWDYYCSMPLLKPFCPTHGTCVIRRGRNEYPTVLPSSSDGS